MYAEWRRVFRIDWRKTVNLLLDALDEAFDHKSWHGTNLRGSLRRVTAEEAVRRPGPGRHNIWEIALHCAYWKYAVWRQLTGAKRASFPLKGSNFWLRDKAGEQLWAQEIGLLEETHRQLREAAGALKPSDWLKKPVKSKYTCEFLVRGAAAHDLYHAGQIQLIKRLV